METFILIAFLAFVAWWVLSNRKDKKARLKAIVAKEKKQEEMYQRIIDELDKNVPEVQ